MNIQYLKEFIVFGEHLNFTTAARSLYLSQPTLSQHIAALEEEVGFALVERGRASLRLTNAGEHFLERAQDIINLCSRSLSECRAVGASRTTLRVQDHSHSIRLMEYHERALKLLDGNECAYEYKLRLIPFGRQSLDEMLKREFIDLGFVYAEKDSPAELDSLRANGLAGFKLYTEPCHIYLLANSTLANKQHLCLADLEGKTAVAVNLPAYASYRRAIKSTFARLGVELHQKFVSRESPIEKSPVLENYTHPNIVIDLEFHRESLEKTWGSAPIAKRPLEGIDLGIDICVAYDAKRVTKPLQTYLDALENTSAQ